MFTTYAPAQLLVYDTQAAVYRDSNSSRWWWPMYGYNPLRRGCLACDNDKVSGVEDAPPIGSITFATPMPNPTSGRVSVNFMLPEAAAVRLDVFDTQGRLVDHLLKDELQAGPHQLTWTARDASGSPLAGGVYYMNLLVNGPNAGRTPTRKVVVVP